MSEQLSRRFRQTLNEEIKQWQNDEVISPEVAERLKALYPVPEFDSKLISVALVIGALMIGSSALSFVGTNWEHINRIAKLAMMVGAMLATYVTAWHFCYEPGRAPRIGGALIDLGVLLFGACIWMVTQFLNFDTNLTTGLLYWSIGTALVTCISRSQITCCLLILQLISLQALSIDMFSSQTVFLPVVIPAALALVWLCARVRSRVALSLTLAGAFFTIGIGSGTHWAGMVVVGSIMVSAYFLWKDRWKWFVTPCLYVGSATGLVGFFFMSIDMSSTLNVYNLSMLFAIAALPLLFYRRIGQQAQKGIIWSLSFAVAACAANILADCCNGARVLSAVGLFFGLVVVLTVASIKLKKLTIMYVAVGLAILQIGVRFCGFQTDSVLLQSITFSLVGAIVFISGAIAECRRRKLLIHSPS